MKKQSNTLFAIISSKMVENLTNVVKETLATEFNQPANKIFTAADLWSIQRQRRTRTQRRLSF
ncbi:MAG: hypothetical protein WKI04_08785 [Ferruginibacter sp.]